ncbi:hypothetical protein ACLOJK_009715 [Asimina triloba]
MADALVSIAKKKLADVAKEKLDLFTGAADELEKLKNTFQSIEALLDDAERRQVGEESVRLWLSRLKAVSYDIDDVLDEWGTISSGGLGDEEGGVSRSKVWDCLLSIFNCLDGAVSRYEVACAMKEIRKRLDDIADEKNKYGFFSSGLGVGGDLITRIRSSRLKTSVVDSSEKMIGRDNDKETMISRLVSGSGCHHDQDRDGQVHVVAMVGIGGMGKTTLARQIYHDSRVRGHFDEFLWVCVSDVFDVIRLTKAITEQVKGTSTSFFELDPLQNELLQALRGKRFLLVLDDIWNDDEDNWKLLKLPLNSGEHGSKILVTTRSEKVAKTMNATFIHELQGLSDDDSWELFMGRAFAWRKAEEYSKLEIVGRKIVLNCKGVPLSIKVIGSAMHSKRTPEDWENILDSKIWSLPQVTDKILPALWLSYCYLPSHLKQCFVYCSMFHKDWNFDKDTLVKLWVAQGFIRSEGSRAIEEISADYFDDLVAWSMLQPVESVFGTRYVMHDLLHDLAELIGKDEIYAFTVEGEKSDECPSISSNVRHALLYSANTDYKPSNMAVAFGRANKLRTLYLNRVVMDSDNFDLFQQAKFLRTLVFTNSPSMLPKSIGKLKHLRFLDLSLSNVVELPNAVGMMRQLRYLDLFRTKIVELPESVSQLSNLHTLDVRSCRNLKRLPRNIGNMVGLKHLEISWTSSLWYLPQGLGRINHLQSLSKFIVGGGDEEGEGCGIDELQSLNSLRGSLQIEHLEKVSSREEAEKAQLWNKPGLRSLVLTMSETDDTESERMESVLEGLQPHANLEELEIERYASPKLPSWIEAMTSLRILKLCSCPNLERLPHPFANSSLIELMISDCHRIKGVEQSYYSAFQLLEKFSLIDSSEFFSSGLPNLPILKTLEIRKFRRESLPNEGWEQLVELQKLEIGECNELKYLPDGILQLQSLEHLNVSNCDKLESLPEGLGQLKKLKTLDVRVLEMLTCLPDSLGELASLEGLCIINLGRLQWLPEGLGQLKALNLLEICDCDALESLPDGLQHLGLRGRLQINNCQLLLERYEREGGKDWPTISRIPMLTLDMSCPPSWCNRAWRSRKHKLILSDMWATRSSEPQDIKTGKFGNEGCERLVEISDCNELKSLPDGLLEKDLDLNPIIRNQSNWIR